MATSRRLAAVILAGGLGTRLREVLPDLPKPMAPVAGRPFVEWVVRYLARQGVRDIVISTGYRAEAFNAHFANLQIEQLDSVRCIAEPEPLGTAGGFVFAAQNSGLTPDAWLVLNGDSLVLADLAPAIACDADGALLSIWMSDASRYGSLELRENFEVTAFHEKRPGSAWINAGVYLFSATTLADFPPERPLSFEKDVFPRLIENGRRIKAVPVEAEFLDIGLPDTLAKAPEFIRRNQSMFC